MIKLYFYFLIKKKRQLFITVFSLFLIIPAWSKIEKIKIFKMKSCLKKYCIKLNATYAERSYLSTQYVLLKPVLILKSDNKNNKFVGEIGIYDVDQKIIIIKEMSGREHKSLIFNLSEEKMTLYKR